MEWGLPSIVRIVAAYGFALPDRRAMVRESEWPTVESNHFSRRRIAEAMAAWRRSISVSRPDTVAAVWPLLFAAVLTVAFFGLLFSFEAGFF